MDSQSPSLHSDTLSLTQSNSCFSRKRLRAKELATHAKDTLIQMLVKQELSTDDARKLLRGALDKLDQYKLDLLDANHHCRKLQTACQKLTDERILHHTQVTDAVAKAYQQASAAQQELSLCKLRLEHAEQALATTNADLRQAKHEASTSHLETERLRTQLHHLREQTSIHEAREQGRKQGYDQGLHQGRVLTHPMTTYPSAPDTSVLAGDGGAFIEEANTTRQSAAPSSTHQPPVSTFSSPASRDPRPLKASFDSVLSQARQETQLRLQREFEHQLAAERHRLQLLNLQREQASQDQSDQFQKRLEETQRQIQEFKDMHKRLQEELRKEKQIVEQVREERNQERDKRQEEEKARQRDREERELERQWFASERAKHAEQRERERHQMAQKDAQRDRLLAEASATAAQAVQAASATAAAVGSTSTRPTSATSNPNSDHESSFSNLRSFGLAPIPYIPMPRPPMDMPVPSLGLPLTVMPEPSPRPPSRSTQQPALPQILPARQGGARNRRLSTDSQSSMSTVTGAFDSLVSFPHAVPSVVLSSERASSSGSTIGGGNGRGVLGVSGAAYGRPNHSASKDGPHGNPERDKEMLSDIPEDASFRSALSPSASSSDRAHPSTPIPVPPPLVLNMQHQGQQQQQPPGWYANPMGTEDSSDENGGPVIPIIHVDVGDDHWRSGEHEDNGTLNSSLLNPGRNMRRPDSANSARPSLMSNSSYEIVVESPSTQTSSSDPHSEPPHLDNQFDTSGQYLSPAHATIPIPPIQVSSRNPSEQRQRSRQSHDWDNGIAGRQDDVNPPTQPSSPSIPPMDMQNLPPGFIPQSFTPHTAPFPSLPPPIVNEGDLPSGFVPQSITDTTTGLTNPLMGRMPSALPDVSAGATVINKNNNSGKDPRRTSLYGNPNTGRGGGDDDDGPVGAMKWGSSTDNYNKSYFLPSRSPTPPGPPVIADLTSWSHHHDSGFYPSTSRRNTPRSRTKSIYGTPSTLGESSNLPGGLQIPVDNVGGGVYQNPLRQEEEEGEGERNVNVDADADDSVARNTRINAIAPLPHTGGKRKKKKGG